MQTLTDNLTMQFIEIITVGGVKVEIIKDCLDILLFNDYARYLNYIILVVLDYNINNFIDLRNLFSGILLGKQAIFDTFFYGSNSLFTKLLLDLFLLEVAKRSNTLGGYISNGRLNSFANLGNILLRLFADLALCFFNLLLNFLLGRGRSSLHSTALVALVAVFKLDKRNSFEK